MFFYKPFDKIQEIYYNFWSTNGRHAKMFPFIKEKDLDFLANYKLATEFFRHIHPFRFLKSGDTAIQVGFHDQYIELGCSHPLIMAALVGEEGHVYAIDPDPKNINKLNNYITENGINNITTIRKGVWKEKATLNFRFFHDFSSSNMIESVFDDIKEGCEKRWGEDRIKSQSYIEKVEVNALDAIVKENVKSSRIDFINITVNGAESEIIEGCNEIIAANPNVSLAYPTANIKNNSNVKLADMGFNLVLGDAPHRPWDKEQFFYTCATKVSEKELHATKFKVVQPSVTTALSEDGVGFIKVEQP